jgi:hypothetical protein
LYNLLEDRDDMKAGLMGCIRCLKREGISEVKNIKLYISETFILGVATTECFGGDN